MLTIWGRKTSSNVQALMWCVAELDLPHCRHDVGHRFGGLDTDHFGNLNPNRTIPVLEDGQADPLWESGAILRYLAGKYGDDDFWPRDPDRQAQVDKWAEWAKINVAMAFTVPVFWQAVRTAPSNQNPDALHQAVAALDRTLKVADTQLSNHSFLAGSSLTLADIQLGHVLYRYFDVDIPRTPLINLRRYYEALTERPAFKAHVMISYDELRAT